MEYGCIGEHLPHSFSKIIHERVRPITYDLHEIQPEDLDSFMTARAFKAINVTIPYKQAVIPYLYEIDEKAKAIGAVNTIVNREGKLFGYNTDFSGMEAQLNHMGASLAGKKVLIPGTGGTSKTAYAVARHLGAREVYRLSRRAGAGPGILTYEEALARHQDAEVLINTTPCGMYPHVEGQALELTPFKKLETVLDAVYNPLSTQLVRQARSLGARAAGGLYMLVAQAIFAEELFFQDRLPASCIEEVYGDLLAEKRNIVLVGMPSSGKSTIGKRIGEAFQMPVIDTDEEIRKKAGMPIPEIFSRFGEPYFRDLESQVIRELSLEGGKVLSTGGGAVLRPQNVDALKMNGIIVYLDRSLAFLQPTEDRPLSSDPEKLRIMYEVRRPIYEQAADIRIRTDGTREETTEEVLKELNRTR